MKTLENWSIQYLDPYAPPEMGSYLVGICNGKKIMTSRIVKAEDRIITTQSGSKYLLGKVDPNYQSFLKEIGHDPNALPTIMDKK